MILATEDANPWYASGLFWTILAVAIAVIAIPITVWAAFRSANPKRRVHVWLSDVTPLLNRRAQDLELRHSGQVLAEPRLATVTLAVRSTKDIPPDSFTGPIVLDLGTPIVALLSSEARTKRVGLREPAITVAGQTLEIAPSLLARDHAITVSVLVDSPPSLEPAQIALTDVETSLEPPPDPAATGKRIDAVMATLTPYLAIIAGWIAILAFDIQDVPKESILHGRSVAFVLMAGCSVGILIAQFTEAYASFVNWLFKRIRLRRGGPGGFRR